MTKQYNLKDPELDMDELIDDLFEYLLELDGQDTIESEFQRKESEYFEY